MGMPNAATSLWFAMRSKQASDTAFELAVWGNEKREGHGFSRAAKGRNSFRL